MRYTATAVLSGGLSAMATGAGSMWLLGGRIEVLTTKFQMEMDLRRDLAERLDLAEDTQARHTARFQVIEARNDQTTKELAGMATSIKDVGNDVSRLRSELSTFQLKLSETLADLNLKVATQGKQP